MNTGDADGVNALIAACAGGHIHCLKVIIVFSSSSSSSSSSSCCCSLI